MTPRVTVRPAAAADDLDVLMAAVPGWVGAGRIAERMRAAPVGSGQQWVVEVDGALVGYAHCLMHPLGEGGRAEVRLWVTPAARRQGAGAALWSTALAMTRDAGLPGVLTSADVDDETSRGIARSHGLIERGLRLESRLDLATLNSDVIDAAVQRARSADAEITAFPEAADDTCWAQFYDDFLPLHWDTPDGLAGRQPPPLSVLREYLPEGWQILLAQRDDRTVGMTLVIVRHDGAGRVNTLFTGVTDSERRRGLSTALKAEHARRLAKSGWRELLTQNKAENASILAANARLGFVVTGGQQELSFDFAAGG